MQRTEKPGYSEQVRSQGRGVHQREREELQVDDDWRDGTNQQQLEPGLRLASRVDLHL